MERRRSTAGITWICSKAAGTGGCHAAAQVSRRRQLRSPAPVRPGNPRWPAPDRQVRPLPPFPPLLEVHSAAAGCWFLGAFGREEVDSQCNYQVQLGTCLCAQHKGHKDFQARRYIIITAQELRRWNCATLHTEQHASFGDMDCRVQSLGCSLCC